MQVSLTDPELEDFVDEQIRLGLYRSPDEVVRTALELLRDDKYPILDDPDTLRRLVAVGVEQIERGETVVLSPGELRAEIEKRVPSMRRG